jgi:hypothetical protein
VSTSKLSIECYRVDEPAATDALERETWAQLRVIVDGRCATQLKDLATNRDSDFLYVPTFPLAQWVVRHWWQLLYEPCRQERPPLESASWRPEGRRWVHRHCLRSAETGLVLPYLHVFSDGLGVEIVWFADNPQSSLSGRCLFLSTGSAKLSRQDASTGLSEFVAKVLSWCGDSTDERVELLRADWDAITNSDREELAFCFAAGRLGLDPYCTRDWNPGLAELIATDIGTHLNEPLVEDLLESADPASASDLWRWSRDAQQSFGLESGSVERLIPSVLPRYAKDHGYATARMVRSSAGLAVDRPIIDIAALARSSNLARFAFTPLNHLPGQMVHAAVGWRGDSEAVVVGPQPKLARSQRFLEARGLYHALVGCQRGARLVTRARTWDQQASRAFAAELLAPQQALAANARPDMESDERDSLTQELAQRYDVSSEVVRLQLQNEGVWRGASDFDEFRA